MKLHLPKALAAAVMALFAVPNALAETVTITMGGNQYAGTTVLTAATTIEPKEGDYVLFNMGSNKDYTISSSSDWVCSTAKTLIMGNATYVDPNTSETITCPTSRLYVNAASGTLTVGANLILGSAQGEDADVLHFKGSGTTAAVLNGQVSVVNTLARIWNEAGTNYMQGKILAEGKTIKVVGTKAGAVLRLAGGGTIGTLNLGQAGGSVTLSATNQVETAANGLEYTITTMASENSDAALTVESGVTLHLTNFNAGTLSNSGMVNLTNYKGGTLTNTGTVKFAASSSLGTMLSVGGTLDLSEITTLNVDVADCLNFILSTSLPESNGYYGEKVTLLSYTGNGSVAIGDNITGVGLLEGATISYDGTEKQLQATFAADSGVYCVVSDTDTTTNAALSDSKTTSIVLDNATLGLDSGWNDLKGISSLGGIINIASGSSLSAPNLQATAATKLDGAGQYIMSSPGAAISNLGSNVSLADNWTGVVTISGGNRGSALSALAKDAKSTIEFKGFSGYDSSNWGGVMAYNVKLTNAGDLVAWSNDAWASSENTGKFTGKWSGSGTFLAKVQEDKFQNYKYTGNISEWTGEFHLNNGTTNLTFGENANVVKINIGKTAGTLNLAVECTSKTTMSGSVSVDKVTVAANSGGLEYTGSGMSLTSLEGTLTIGSNGVVNGPSNGALSLGTGSNSTVEGKILIDVGGSFSSDGMTYTANGQQATIAGNGSGSLYLYQGTVSISNAVLQKTADGPRHINVSLDNVALKLNNGTTELRGSANQGLSGASIAQDATLEVQNTNATIEKIDGAGTFVTTVSNTQAVQLGTTTESTFTGTLKASKSNSESGNSISALLTAKFEGTGAQVGSLTKIDATDGSVNLLNTSSVTVTDMVIGAGQTVGVYTGDSAVVNPTSTAEGALTVTNLTVTSSSGSAATLNADLTLSTGGTLTLNGTLAMGSTLTLNRGITLSGSLLDSWTDKSNALTLFSGVDGLTVNGNAVSDGVDNGVTASEVFGDSWSNYKLVMTGGTNNKDYNVLLVQTSDTPEPTTATLSLLALMGLAARRRRKAAK